MAMLMTAKSQDVELMNEGVILHIHNCVIGRRIGMESKVEKYVKFLLHCRDITTSKQKKWSPSLSKEIYFHSQVFASLNASPYMSHHILEQPIGLGVYLVASAKKRRSISAL